MTEANCTAPDELTFGSALNELDQIVAALESGQLELEDSLGRYERGVALLRALQAKLADAQQRVTMLIGELESEAGTEGSTHGGRGRAGRTTRKKCRSSHSVLARDRPRRSCTRREGDCDGRLHVLQDRARGDSR